MNGFQRPPSPRPLLIGLSFIALSSLFGPLTACKPKITNANIEAVNLRQVKAEQTTRKGLSPKEVESILGLPDRIENNSLELETQKKQVPITRYYYQQDGQNLELHFIDNKLIDKVPLLGTLPPSAPSPTPPEAQPKSPQAPPQN
jgi:hypothetical protein